MLKGLKVSKKVFRGGRGRAPIISGPLRQEPLSEADLVKFRNELSATRELTPEERNFIREITKKPALNERYLMLTLGMDGKSAIKIIRKEIMEGKLR